MVRTFGDSRRQRSFPSHDALARALWERVENVRDGDKTRRVRVERGTIATRRDATRRDTRATRRLRGATLRDARVTNVCERRVEDHRRIEASKRENERASRANARSAVHARSSAGHARARPQEAN